MPEPERCTSCGGTGEWLRNGQTVTCQTCKGSGIKS
jgi:DnaJ-class molecular chaperone